MGLGVVMKFRSLVLGLMLCLSGALNAQAQGTALTIMPISLDMKPPKVSDYVTVRNEGRYPVKVQVRIFRWVQKGGKDVYYPTTDVVASPPFLTIKGNGSDGNIRISRVSNQPIAGEEHYRLFIDQLPNSRVRTEASGSADVGVQIVMRQIIPVYFSRGTGQSAVSFKVSPARGGFNVSAANAGAKRVSMSKVILLSKGVEIGRLDKLAGYALPGSSFDFFVPGKVRRTPDTVRFTSGEGAVMEVRL